MSMTGTSVDDPQTLRKLMAMAQPNQSHIGRMLDAGRAHAHLTSGGGGACSTAPKSHSVAKKERDRLLQLQREQQAAWDVSATRELVLPALRTMAPSFTKTSDAGLTELGGTKIGEAGYNTIIGIVPTAETIGYIADEDELISSFRPYRIDAVRAARAATATTESAPHPDDARVFEPTLHAICSSRLIDGHAIPADIVRAHWGTASVFAAASPLSLYSEERPHSAANSQSRNAASGHRMSTRTSTFSASLRFKEGKNLPGVRKPALGHYHIRYSLVDPRVVGGYMSARESVAVTPRGAKAEEENGTVDGKGTNAPPQQSPLPASGVIQGAESTRDFGLTAAKTTRTVSPVHKVCAQSVTRGSSMFVSATGRSAPTAGRAARDLDYWPYADVRSTSKRPKCPIKFDVKLNERRHDGVVPSPVVGQYDVAGDISRNLSRVVCMTGNTGRANDWRNKAAVYQDAKEAGDVDRALEATRPHVRRVAMAPRVTEGEEIVMEAPDATVSIERDLNYPRTTFDPRTVRKVRNFCKMVGRDAMRLPPSYEPTENVELQLVTKRSHAVSIHPKAPGHAPMHRANPTEIGEVPNLQWVRPTTWRSIQFGVGAERPFAFAHMHDLRYDTEKRLLVDTRTTGNPMMESQVSRDRRAKVFVTTGCGAVAVYNTDIPTKGKSVPLFEKQITKETQFCGHRLQSERWERNNPKAPGPGHYDVSFRLVE